MIFRIALFSAISLLSIGCHSNPSDNEKEPSSSASSAPLAHFVFIGDPHYGEFRDFREDGHVSGGVVNAALVSKLNTLSGAVFPKDQADGAGDTVRFVDFVMVAGDLLDKNVHTKGLDSSKIGWKEFSDNYLRSIVLQSRDLEKTKVQLMVGNHDVPSPFVMSQIYNRTMNPGTPLDEKTYEYKSNRIHYSFDWAGVHVAVLNIWPDSTELAWLEEDLQKLVVKKPVILFAHDPPKPEATHFSNPNGLIYGTADPFDNLLDPYKEGSYPGESTVVEERAFTKFLKNHSEIKAFFHGHNNFQEFYTYRGPDKDIELPIIRVDSPMKGQLSEISEERLSFQVVTIDSTHLKMTVRECLWNPNPQNVWEPVRWGASMSISLRL